MVPIDLLGTEETQHDRSDPQHPPILAHATSRSGLGLFAGSAIQQSGRIDLHREGPREEVKVVEDG